MLCAAVVVKILNETYGARVELKDTAIANCKLSTTFRQKNLKEVLEVISATLNIRVSEQGSTIELYGEGC